MASRPGPEQPRSRLWNASHDRRLARLEQAKLERERRPATKVFYVWRNAPAESTKAAIARTFPRGLPADARLVICSWQRRQAREPDHRGVA